MSYQGSAVCKANRVHFCQYCNTIYSYPITKNLFVSGALTRESAADTMAAQADAFIHNYVEDQKCPHCGQYQTVMAYNSLSKWCVFRFIAVIAILFFLYSILFSILESNTSSSYLAYLALCLPFALEIIWQCFTIRKFYSKKPEQIPQDVNEDAREEYRFQRNVIQKLKYFLWFGFLCCFIPVFGMCIAGCALLTYYVIVFFMPGRFRYQGLPLFANDARIL